MTPADAAKVLDLPIDASPEQLEARFHELRRKLEAKIAKAPTSGLQAKYRESLVEITTAFETLTLAADSSSLPVIQKQGVGSKEPGVPAQPTLAPSSKLPAPSPSRPKAGGKEFLLVAVIAVLLLAGGGWFVLKTRADNAAAVRLAAETAAKKQAAEQVELARVNSLKTSLRAKLAEARVDWEAHESDLQDAERRANDLKSELRGLRDAPPVKKAELSAQLSAQELYTRWLKNHLLRHPAKLARVRAEELLQSGAHDEAAKVVEAITAGLAALMKDVNYRRDYFFKTTMSLRLHSKPEGVEWFVNDAYGRVHAGKTPARLEGLPLTHLARDGVPVAPFELEKRGEFTAEKVTINFHRPGWSPIKKEATAMEDTNEIVEAEFAAGAVTVTSLPAGVPFTIVQADPNHGWTASGTTPATIPGVPVGRVTVRLARPGFRDVTWAVAVEAAKTTKTPDLDQRAQPVRISVAESPARITIDGKASNGPLVEVSSLAPGEHTLVVETNGYKAYRTKFTTAQNSVPLSLSFSFKELSVENMKCSACAGGGRLNRKQTCRQCNGTTRAACGGCKNGVSGYVTGDYGGGVQGQKMVKCTSCNGRGYFACTSCTNGVSHWQDSCGACSGDGKVSKLQLSQ